ncbi:NPCBM/NEW2 domain-containing protein [Spirosoma luteum]|uniref:NPCBM/NEW2 domain-containing protein n=1 Tax=Spirosoma luteum TaxID=431553 RepID=UPI0003725F29|nr:NPCBM/NEW2 domain-containing protein [Spirosoma luteum]
MSTVLVSLKPSSARHVGRALAIFLLLLATSQVFAQNIFYVAVSGNDSNSGRSADSPYQSLAKINSLSLQPGDQVLLRRGDTFRGTLYIRQSGSSGNPIIVDAYGLGDKPIIAGSSQVTGWNNIGNNTWQASCSSCGSRVTGVYNKNAALPLGRYPNLSDSNKGYLTIQSHNGTGQITSQQGLPTNFTGGEAVLRSAAWVIDRAQITSQSGNTLSLSYNTTYQPLDNWGYFIQNHPATLDQTGEWYYNPSDKTIRIYDNQNNPNNQLITATTASEGVNLSNSSYVTVRNIRITQTLSSGLLSNNGNGITLSGNDITLSGENGVSFSGSGNSILVENNLIEDANNTGFLINVYQNFTFRGNTVQRIGLLAGRGGNGDGTYSGLQSASNSNTLIENNVFDKIGYTGVTIGSSSTVRYNRVSNYCLTKSDGGGLYISNGGRANLTDVKFQSNIVYNGIGAPEGTQIQSTSGAHGIFLDDCTINAEVSGNTIFQVAGMGIFLRGAYNCTIKNNTSFDNGEEQLKIVANGTCAPRNIINQNNILVSKLATALVAAYESNANDLSSFGSFDHNYYVRPFSDQFKIQAVYNPGTGGTGGVLSLAEWQNRFGLDKNSFNSPITYKSQMATQTGTTLLNYSYSSGADGWNAWSPYGNGRLDWDNSGKLDGGSMRLSFASASGRSNSYLLTTVNLGSVRKGQTYQLLLDGVASGPNKRLTVYPRQQGGNYRDLAERTTFVLGTSRQNNEATFTANADESNAILVVQADEDGQTAWVDNLIMREATLTTLNPSDYVKIVYNATGQTTNVGLDATYRDVKNNAYTGQITLAPYSSAVLLKQLTATTPTPVSLRDPENPTSTTNGLDYKYYEGSWNVLPDFSSLTAAKTGTSSQPDLSVRGRDSYFGLQVKGYFNAPIDGMYTFYTTSDDGSKLYIGTTEVVSNDGQHAAKEKSGSIGLKAGKHAITVAFFQGNGDQTLNVSYEGPGSSKQAIPASAFYRVPTTAPTGSGVYLSDLNWTSANNGYGPVEKDKSNGDLGAGDGRAITLNGQTYAKGLGVHAASSISYNLGGQYTQFTTDMGLDDEMASTSCGNVEFQIFVDGTLVYRSGNMNAATATKSVTLDVSGKQTLMLVVTDGGDGYACDHADWAGARLSKSAAGRMAAVQSEVDAFTAEVYPIPTRETLRVRYWAQTSGNLSIQLLNETSQQMLQQVHSVTAGENMISLPVQNITRGFYILSLIQGQHRITRKVILSE